MVNSKNSKFNSASASVSGAMRPLLIALYKYPYLLTYLLAVPDNSASQSYLSACDAQCLSSLFLSEFTEGAVTTKNSRLFHTFVILMLNEYFRRL